MDTYIPNWNAPSVKATEKLAKAVSSVLSTELDGGMDQVHPCGSFLLRTAVLTLPKNHATATPSENQEGISKKWRDDGCPIAFDMCVEIPVSQCSLEDLTQGRYHSCRQSFLRKVKKALVSNLASLEDQAELNPDQGFFLEVDTALWGGLEQRDIVIVRWGVLKASSSSSTTKTKAAADDAEEDDVPQEAEQVKVTKGFVHLFPRPSAAPAKISSAQAFKKHPIYSTVAMTDFLMVELFQRTHQLVTNSPAMGEAIVALKAWAVHVGYASTSISFNAENGGATTDGDNIKGRADASSNIGGSLSSGLVAMFISLVDAGFIQANMTTENMVRAFWVQLTKSKFLAQQASGEGAIPSCSLGENHLNFLYFVSSDLMVNELKPLASQALGRASWLDVFSHRAYTAPQLRYDCVLSVQHLPSRAAVLEAAAAAGTNASDASYSAFAQKQHKSKELTTAIKYALGSRAKAVFCDYHLSKGTAVIGINVVSENEAKSRVVRGPSIEQTKKVKEFNNFWGEENTSTRQFADGAVFRCRVWADPSEELGIPTTVTSVLRDISAAAVTRHFGETATVGSPLEDYTLSFLRQRIGGEWKDAEPLCQASLRDACSVIEHLFSDVANASALPCDITGFKIISEAARGTAAFHPREHVALLTKDHVERDVKLSRRMEVGPKIEPMHAVVTIDDHNKIPDHLEAIAKMKGALLASLSKALTEKSKRMTGAAKHTIKCLVTRNSVDVVVNGYFFKVYLGHFREISLLKALNKTAEADTLERKLFMSQQHSSYIQQAAGIYGSYSHTVRLAQRWIGAMMLGEYVLPECVELLVAYIYNTRTTTAPKSPGHGFYCFLQLVALFPWARHPLVMPGVATEEKLIFAARKTHESTLDSTTKGMIWIAAPYAETTSPFTLHTPRPAVLSYLVDAARSSLASMAEALRSGNATAWNGVWSVDTSAVYDVTASFSPSLPLAWDRCITVGKNAAHMSKGLNDLIPPTKMLFLDDHVTGDSATSLAAAATVVRGGKNKQIHNSTEGDAALAAYLSPMVEFDPAAMAAKTVRAQVRDLGMVMYDPEGPNTLGFILLGKEPSLKKVKEAISRMEGATEGALVNVEVTSSCQHALAASKVAAQIATASAKAKKQKRIDQREKEDARDDDGAAVEKEDKDTPAKKKRRVEPTAATPATASSPATGKKNGAPSPVGKKKVGTASPAKSAEKTPKQAEEAETVVVEKPTTKKKVTGASKSSATAATASSTAKKAAPVDNGAGPKKRLVAATTHVAKKKIQQQEEKKQQERAGDIVKGGKVVAQALPKRNNKKELAETKPEGKKGATAKVSSPTVAPKKVPAASTSPKLKAKQGGAVTAAQKRQDQYAAL